MALFAKTENNGLKLFQITEFSFFFVPQSFCKILQSRLACSNDFIERIKKVFPKNITCKIESFEDDNGWGHQRAKVWERHNDKGCDYFEVEDIDYEEHHPFCFWEIMFSDLLTDEEQSSQDNQIVSLSVARLQAVFDFPMNSFLIILSGDNFEKKNDSLVDFRMLKDKITDNAILLKLSPHDFRLLQVFDDENGPSMPGDPDYYFATAYHRRYSNWRCGKPGSVDSKERGICWNLNLYDFSQKIFPKVERNKMVK
jgi:hypothetical protein